MKRKWHVYLQTHFNITKVHKLQFGEEIDYYILQFGEEQHFTSRL